MEALRSGRDYPQSTGELEAWFRTDVDCLDYLEYLNGFVFRFNRRSSRSRGLLFYRVLELAAGHEPVRYSEMIASRRPRRVRPTPPGARGHPPSLDRPPAGRPWRAASAVPADGHPPSA